MMYKLTLISVLLISFIGHAQKLSNYENRKSIRSNNQFVTFHVEEVDQKRKNKNYNPRKEYYWYKSQEVKHTQGGSAGLLLHGLYERFYINKQIAAKGTFRKGLKHGKWSYWNEDGKIIGFERYKRGRLIHIEEIDPETGKPLLLMNRGMFKLRYKSPEKSLKTNKDSTRVQIIQFDDHGRVLSNEKFLYGDLHGRQVYYEKGEKRVLKYKKGVLLKGDEENDLAKDSLQPAENKDGAHDESSPKKEKAEASEKESEMEEETAQKKRFKFWPFNRKNKNEEENETDDKVED